jgi:phosphoglycolate phosphatase
MVKLVLFDIDGTLVRTGHAGTQAFAKTFATEFKLHHGTEKIKFSGRTDVSLVREFFRIHDLPETPEHFAQFFERYVFWLDQILARSHTQICPGVWELIHALRALPAPPVLGLLTGNIRLGAEIKLRHTGLWDIFKMGGFADDSEDRNLIAVAAKERGSRLLGKKLSGPEVLVIGDTPHDIRCGRYIDAKVLAVATGGATLEELKAHNPDWAVENLTHVSAKEIVSGK